MRILAVCLALLPGLRASVIQPLGVGGFEENLGQAEPPVRYLFRGAGYRAAIAEDCSISTTSQSGGSFRLRPAHAKQCTLEAGGRLSSVVNYYHGRDPRGWLSGVPQYARIHMRELYPEIDVEYRMRSQGLEFLIAVKPGAVLERVEWWVSSATVTVEGDGRLRVNTGSQPFHYSRPEAWQEEGGRRIEVPIEYRAGRNSFGFRVGRHDPGRTLFIDPVLAVSTYFGGSGFDAVYGVTTDANGFILATGQTDSAQLPGMPAGSPPRGRNRDVFVTKLSPDGQTAVYTTILAGSGDDQGTAIAADSSGRAYVTGVTRTADFPVTAGAAQTQFGGSDEGFVAQLDKNGALLAATFVGGSGLDQGTGIAVDASGAVYVAGSTSSTGFPTTSAAPQRSYGGGTRDAWLMKLAPGLTTRTYATFYGGSGLDSANAVAVDSTGLACMAGYTESPNLSLSGALQSTLGGTGSAFVACINPTGDTWTQATYLGGSSIDEAWGVAMDAAGAVYVCGQTMSSDFPTTSGAFQTIKHGDYDAFVTKISGGVVSYSTMLGGSKADVGTSIGVDGSGRAWVGGYTLSTDFPTSAPLSGAAKGNFDGFLAELSADGGTLTSSTYFGGTSDDRILSVRVAGAGNALFGGFTSSADLPLISPRVQTAAGGGYEGFLARMVNPQETSPPFGFIDTPADGAAGITGEVGVTGWALDDLEVTRVEIWRDPVSGEPAQQIYVGDATFVAGARPDVAAAYPSYPFSDRAGWGLMVLTNMLPGQGNGTFKFYVYADDAEGHQVMLGTRTMTCTNASATQPFGTLDTPTNGATVSGGFYNFGWVLTPQPAIVPIDGSTISVWIDGVPQGHPSYNSYRADIATLLPGYQNSNGAVGSYYIDTRKFANGIHSISWSATDSLGRTGGLGSRYFWINNP